MLLFLFFTVTVVVVVKTVRPFVTVFILLQLSFHYLTYTDELINIVNINTIINFHCYSKENEPI
jgi:hypothetical protein